MATFASARFARSPCLGSQTRSKPLRLVVRAQNDASERGIAKFIRSAGLSPLVRPAIITAVSNVILALPAAAETGKLFDFNLTGPVMAGEFLLLMVFLDKFWFGPVGDMLDERDKYIRDKLASVSDNSEELEQLQAEAEKTLREARSKAQAEIQEARSESQAEMDAEVDAAKEKVDAELEAALAALDREKELAMQTLDAQVDKLSAEILGKILPEGVTIS